MAIKKIDIGKLKSGMVLADNVYGEIKGNKVLLMAKNTLISNDGQVRRLIDGNIKFVEIDTDRGADTFLSLTQQKKWDDVVKETKDVKTVDQLLSRHISNFINSVTTTIMKTHTSRLYINEEPVSSIIKEMIIFVENHTDILLAMIRLKSLNEYTFNHSINTTVLCISIANSLGFKYNDIVRFATGTFLADVGMSSYPSKMVSRPSGLAKKEIEEIQKHPAYAVEFLKKNGIDDPLIEAIILQHHERFDGSGYPYGLKDEEIHPISKLFAIADVYVAMTSSRPHRPGIPPHMVLGEIHKMSGTLFDPKMKDYFIKHVGVYPAGNMVELTSGNVAIVVSQNKSDPLRPLVIVFQKARKLSASSAGISAQRDLLSIKRGAWELVDLSTDDGRFGKIVRGVDHRKYNININSYLIQV
ncbi:HD-GYP domain-containing protein [bacterium]|nr:HD-GYP domain-containing protein [bacterium]